MTATQRPLRVLFMPHSGAAGGAGSSLRHLVQSFPEGAIEATVLSPRGRVTEGFREIGVPVFEVPATSTFLSIHGAPARGFRSLTVLREFWNFRVGPTIRRVLRQVQPDLVHLNERGMTQAAAISQQCGVPVVLHARSNSDYSNPIVNTMNAWCARHVDAVIAIDQSVARSLRRYGRTEVIYNPLPTHLTSLPLPEPRDQDEVHVAFLANLLPSKGIYDLLDAAAILRKRRDIHFQIYGGNSRPPEFFQTWFGKASAAVNLANDVEAALRRRVEREQLQATVHLHGNVQLDADLFHRTDILAFPSHYNAIGRSVFEAGLFGVPSVVTMEDDVDDIVAHEYNGLVTTPRNPRGLADAIRRLADDAALRRRLGLNAHSRYRNQFAPSAIARQVLELYHSVLDERRQGRTQPIRKAA